MDEKSRLAACFERGRHAARDRNYAYAKELMAVCVSEAPESLQYAEAFLATLKASFGSDRKKAGHLLALKGAKEFKKALADKDWRNAIRLGAAMLSSDPWDGPTLRGMAEACEGLHYNEVELVYLKQALDAAPKDVEVNRHCARSLARMGQFDQAIACWHRVEEIRGKDAEAAEMVLRLTQEKMQYPGGRPPEAPKPSPPLNSPPSNESPEPAAAAPVMAEPLDVVPETPRQKLERLIQADPANLAHYLKLTEQLLEAKHFDEAERLLIKARQHCAQTKLVDDTLQKVASRRLAHQHEEQAKSRRQLDNASKRGEKGGLRFPWLELLLVSAGVALLFQLIPSWWAAVFANLQIALIVLNLVVVIGLIGWQIRARNIS
jgi:tetratricopeptide (TPR) repeat protein